MAKRSRKESTKNEAIKSSDLCQNPSCKNRAVITCKYCVREFCKEHSEPRMVTNFHFIDSIDREGDYKKWQKYNDDWQRKDGHACSQYTTIWNKEYEEAKGIEAQAWKRSAYKEHSPHVSTSSSGGQTYYDQNRYSPKYSRKRGFYVPSWLYEKWVLKEALIFAIILTVITVLPLGLIRLGGGLLSIPLLSSSDFLSDFIVIFIVFVIYNKIAHRRSYAWEGVAVALITATILLSVIQLTPTATLIAFIEILTASFVSIYLGILIGKQSSTYTLPEKIATYSIRGILLIVIIIVIANLTLRAAPLIAALNFSAKFNNTLSNPGNAISQISNSLGSLNIAGPAINGTWATQFFSNVSTTRGNAYAYCPSLSNFAKVRFNTMSANYGISHYGYNQNFQSFYGTVYNTYFGEEVFYPSGYTPSGYVSDIQTSAPLHWQLLSSNNFSDYGYYIRNGPDYVIYGPNGGYATCSVTEIPGPNINISQYFAQYGCTVAVSNQTWFVIELASSCP